MSLQTPLHSLHERLGARLVDFAGWSLPVQFSGILGEHKQCRSAAAMFDTSHMGQLRIVGPRAAARLSEAITPDAEALGVGRGKYGFLLNDSGGVMDDCILFRLGGEEFLLVVNAGTAKSDAAVLTERMGDVPVEPMAGWGKIDLQGPRSFDVLAPLAESGLEAMNYFDCRKMSLDGAEGIVARCGYTGELGYEIFLPADDLLALSEKLLASPEVLPAGLGARDSLRLEMGYPLYGHELTEKINPLQAGLGGFLDLRRNFVGADALRAIRDSDPAQKLVALRGQGRKQFHDGDEILDGDQCVGTVTSGAFSPSLGVAMGLGFVENSIPQDRSLTVQTQRGQIPVATDKPPLYKKGTCRISVQSPH